MEPADDPVAARERRRAAYRARERARNTRAFDAFLKYAYGEATDMHRESETHHNGDYGVPNRLPRVCICNFDPDACRAHDVVEPAAEHVHCGAATACSDHGRAECVLRPCACRS